MIRNYRGGPVGLPLFVWRNGFTLRMKADKNNTRNRRACFFETKTGTAVLKFVYPISPFRFTDEHRTCGAAAGWRGLEFHESKRIFEPHLKAR